MQPADPTTMASAQSPAAAAGELVDLVLGEDVVSALRAAFLAGGDMTSVAPLLFGPALGARTREVFGDACGEGRADIAGLLFDGADVIDDVAAMHGFAAACAGGHASVAGIFADAAPPGGVAQAFMCACGAGQAGIADELAGRIASASAPDRQAAFEAACDAGLAGPAATLLRDCAGLDTNAASDHEDDGDHTLLTAAADRGDAAVLSLLLGGGADANRTNEDNERTALIIACRKGRLECVRLLLAAAGIELNTADDNGWSSLHHAAVTGHPACLAALLAADGIETGHHDVYHDRTALNLAFYHADAGGCARQLAALEGADLNNPDGWSAEWTVLHHACYRRDAALAKVLLVAGGCRFALSRLGKKPLELCADAPGEVPHPYNHGNDPGNYHDLRNPAAHAKELRAVFLSGVDYWQRKHHHGHAWLTKEAVKALLLVRQRLDARADPARGASPAQGGRVLRSRARARARPPPLPHLPEELWLFAFGFLRSADFVPAH